MMERSQNLDLGESTRLVMGDRSVAVGMAGGSIAVRISEGQSSGGLGREDIVIRTGEDLVVVSMGDQSIGIRPSSKSVAVGLAQKS